MLVVSFTSSFLNNADSMTFDTYICSPLAAIFLEISHYIVWELYFARVLDLFFSMSVFTYTSAIYYALGVSRDSIFRF